MTLDDFRSSLTAPEPPAGLTHALAGLWWDAKGDWNRAHESAQRRGRIASATADFIAAGIVAGPEFPFRCSRPPVAGVTVAVRVLRAPRPKGRNTGSTCAPGPHLDYRRLPPEIPSRRNVALRATDSMNTHTSMSLWAQCRIRDTSIWTRSPKGFRGSTPHAPSGAVPCPPFLAQRCQRWRKSTARAADSGCSAGRIEP